MGSRADTALSVCTFSSFLSQHAVARSQPSIPAAAVMMLGWLSSLHQADELSVSAAIALLINSKGATQDSHAKAVSFCHTPAVSAVT